MPGFPQLLTAIAEAWQNRRKEMLSAGDRLAEMLNRTARLQPSGAPLDDALLSKAAERLMRSFDRHEGGFGGAPKFPQPMVLDFLLQRAIRTGANDDGLLNAVTFTLTKMARGGMYDQLGGGFHRYSTDDEWLAPHFEKMLYDNAQLALTYLHAWQVTGEPFFRQIVEETLDYVLREMTSQEGAFYSTQDADSEGKEGKFFVWTVDEITRLLGPEDGRLFAGYYGVTQRGNWREGGQGANILHVRRELDVVAGDLGVAPERLREVVQRGRQLLFEARESRVHPGRDEKVLAEWNGLMLRAFAETGAALSRADYADAARRNAEFLLTKMRDHSADSVRLFRTYKDGRAHLNGYLEDHAAVALGLLALYQVTFDLAHLQAAIALTESILDRFHDAQNGGFYQTAEDHEKLVARRKDFVDSAIPAGNSLVADLLLRLAKLLDRPHYAEHAAATFSLMADGMAEQPLAFGRLLSALDFYVNPGYEIAIMGNPQADDARGLLAEVYARFMPNSVLAAAEPESEAASAVPLLEGRPMRDGRATAYVCKNYACNLPVTAPEELGKQLAG